MSFEVEIIKVWMNTKSKGKMSWSLNMSMIAAMFFDNE